MRLQHLILFVFVFFVSGCATYKPQYKDENLSTTFPKDKEILHSFYLIGDGGNSPYGTQTRAIKNFKVELNKASKNSTALFLGDNIYPSGLPKKNHKQRKFAEHQLNVQAKSVENFKGETIFIPGNHDWYSSGLKGLKRQEKYIENKLGKNTFLPENGCPIEKIDINEEIVLIIIDSQWYITDWDKHPTINDECEFKTRDRFIDEFEGLIKKARGKTTIVALHHPMFSNGPHGGQYSFGSHMNPAPVLGTLKNILRKTGGVSNTDLQNKRYSEFKDHIVTLAQENDKVIFVSGHEHSLQYLVEDNLPQIISGAGSKTTATRNIGSGHFSYGSSGFARLDVLKDGSSWVRFFSDALELVYQTQVLNANDSRETGFLESFPNKMKASVYSSEETAKSSFYESLWGKRYREYFSTEVEIPTVNLDTLFGGLIPIRKGGGHQSKSLRFEDSKGREYVMRALRKNAVQYLQAVVFTDQYVTPDFEGTKTEALVMDAFTASHPYAPFTIADLSKAVGVYYTTPQLFYVPKQKAIGNFNDEFGDEIYMIEERVGDGHEDKAGFGYSNELISTYDMLEKIRKNEKHVIDQQAYIRARLFDMVIGDWDRHQDQWRWAVFKENGQTIYRPFPRDRDQAFSLMDDGVLMRTATFLIPPIRLLQSYEAELNDPKWFNVEPFPMDVALLTNTTKEDWDKQVEVIQSGLTNDVIDSAFLKFPKEVQDETIRIIREKLIGRRGNLKAISDEYFKIVNKYATVRGTDKDDWFEIERLADGRTSVKVWRIKGGEKKDLFHNRIYKSNENKEIWIFGLDDEDYFEVKGSERSTIVLRLVGGQNKDSYNVLNGNKVHIYDYKSKSSVFESNKGKKHLKDDYFTNVYDYKKVKYNSKTILPILGANPDDGFRIGVGGKFNKNAYKGEKFTAQHVVNGNVYFATGGYDINYQGEFAEVFNNLNLGIEASFTSPNYSINFFGYGNSTPNLNAEEDSAGEKIEDLDYNRVKKSTYAFAPSLIRNGEYGSRVSLGIRYESIEIENTEGRFIENLFGINEDLPRDDFLGADFNYNFTNIDNKAFPTLGLNFDLTFGYRNNVKNSNNFGFIIPSLAIDYKLVPNGQLVLGSKVLGHFNIGDDFEFYQAASIGGNNGLRGYRNERFSGKSAFVQSTDLRLNLSRKKTSVVPIESGIYAGFDYGRVWVDENLVANSQYNENDFNTSFGGGVFFNLVDMITAKLGAFNSQDGLRIAFSFGFGL